MGLWNDLNTRWTRQELEKQTKMMEEDRKLFWSQAWQTGYDQGYTEGLAAGKRGDIPPLPKINSVVTEQPEEIKKDFFDHRVDDLRALRDAVTGKHRKNSAP